MIRNREHMAQLINFKGMTYGRCSPTDIDLSMDFNKEVFIFTELKYKGTGLTVGQRIHLMALVDGLEAGGLEAYAILAHHSTLRTDDIMAADSIVGRVYTKGAWRNISEMSLHEYISQVHYLYVESKEQK